MGFLIISEHTLCFCTMTLLTMQVLMSQSSRGCALKPRLNVPASDRVLQPLCILTSNQACVRVCSTIHAQTASFTIVHHRSASFTVHAQTATKKSATKRRTESCSHYAFSQATKHVCACVRPSMHKPHRSPSFTIVHHRSASFTIVHHRSPSFTIHAQTAT